MPNIRPFCMPKWGIEMTEGTIAEWMVSEGTAFARGQTLCLIETAKITNEVEAEADAVLHRVLVPAGGSAQPVGALLAVIADPGTSEAEVDAFIANFKAADTSVAARTDKPASLPASVAATAATAPAAVITTNRPISPEALKLAQSLGLDLTAVEGSGRHGRITYQDVVQASRPPGTPTWRGPLAAPSAEDARIFASPLARRIAALNGIDLTGVRGTGPRGRICKADVLALVPAPAVGPQAGPFSLIDNSPSIQPFDRVRQTVARRLTEAKQQIPHFYLRISVAVDALVALRRTANIVLGCKASLNDYLVKAVAIALTRHPDVNVQVHGDTLHRFAHADVAIAVASPRGLVTPIIRQADRMRIDQLATASRALIDKAHAGRLGWEDLDGGTFTVSNLGMFGIDEFDAIINPPQAAILAVGAVSRQPAETADGNITFESRMALTLSVDHRAIDGAAGAAFLATLKGLIEDPESLFAA